MKYFVTGGAGFVGSNIVDRLIAENGEVTVYDNLSSGKSEFLSQHNDNPNFRMIKGDLLDFELVKESIEGHDFVFHVAANPDIRYGTTNTQVDLKQGTIATYNVLEAMRQNDIKKIVFTSSSVVYGEAKIMPTPEDYRPLMPISLYGASKLAAEALISAFCNSFGMQAWIFRFANIIGKRGTHGVIVDFIEKLKKNSKQLEILGNGMQSKSYLLVDECVDAIMQAVKHSDESVNVFNLGCGDQVQVSRIAKMLVEELGLTNVEFVYTGGGRGWVGDVPRFLLSTKKINMLGWRAQHSSEEAVRIAIKALIKELWD